MKTLSKLLLICTFTSSAITSADDFEGLFSLSLQELINLEVTTVSKRKESISEAPGVISVITAEDIKNYGATSLKDVLLRLPNFFIFDSSTFKASGAMLRAGATQHLNNHVLYLINGSPLRESQNGGLHTDINLLFPIDIIERIEVIRGPGSVLYGSNAYSGTVNLITKDSQEDFSGKISSQNGTNSFGAHSVSISSSYNEYINLQITANTLKNSGDSYSAFDEDGNTGSQTTAQDGDSFFINLNIHDFSLTSLHNDIRTPAASGKFLWTNEADFLIKRQFYDLGYKTQLTQNWLLSANIISNEKERNVIGPGTGSSLYESNGRVYTLEISGELTDEIKIISGVVQDIVKGDLNLLGGPYETQRQALYGQLDYQSNENLKITTGFQVNKAEDHDPDLSPRLAMVYKYADNWTLKAMHAKAFRSPYGSELFFDSVFLLGDTQLKPETIQTNEVQAIYADDKIALNLTAYHSIAKDLIEREFVNGANVFTNDSGKVYYKGIEAEWNWQLIPSLRFQGNASYQQNEDENNTQDIMVAANEMVKFGLVYKANARMLVGAWNSYIGSANKLEDIPDSSTIIVNPEARSVNLLSINISSDLGYLFNSDKLKDFNVSIYANNILDSDVWYPELGRKIVNTYPQTHTQGIYGTVSYEF